VARYEFINVAMSRARSLLMMLGARSMFEGFEVPLPRMDGPGIVSRPVYRDMLKQLERDGRLVEARQVLAPPRPAPRSLRQPMHGDKTKGGR
jgi:superfamily I DNA and/or RNA helicase